MSSFSFELGECSCFVCLRRRSLSQLRTCIFDPRLVLSETFVNTMLLRVCDSSRSLFMRQLVMSVSFFLT